VYCLTAVTVKITEILYFNNAYVDSLLLETAHRCAWCWRLQTLDSTGCHFQNVKQQLQPVSPTSSQHPDHAVPFSAVCSRVHDSLDLLVNYTSTETNHSSPLVPFYIEQIGHTSQQVTISLRLRTHVSPSQCCAWTHTQARMFQPTRPSIATSTAHQADYVTALGGYHLSSS